MGFRIANEKIAPNMANSHNGYIYENWGGYDDNALLRYLLASLSPLYGGYKIMNQDLVNNLASEAPVIESNQANIPSGSNMGRLGYQYTNAIKDYAQNKDVAKELAIPLRAESGAGGDGKTLVVSKDGVRLDGKGMPTPQQVFTAVMASLSNPDVKRYGINVGNASLEEQVMWMQAAKKAGIVVQNEAAIIGRIEAQSKRNSNSIDVDKISKSLDPYFESAKKDDLLAGVIAQPSAAEIRAKIIHSSALEFAIEAVDIEANKSKSKKQTPDEIKGQVIYNQLVVDLWYNNPDGLYDKQKKKFEELKTPDDRQKYIDAFIREKRTLIETLVDGVGGSLRACGLKVEMGGNKERRAQNSKSVSMDFDKAVGVGTINFHEDTPDASKMLNDLGYGDHRDRFRLHEVVCEIEELLFPKNNQYRDGGLQTALDLFAEYDGLATKCIDDADAAIDLGRLYIEEIEGMAASTGQPVNMNGYKTGIYSTSQLHNDVNAGQPVRQNVGANSAANNTLMPV